MLLSKLDQAQLCQVWVVLNLEGRDRVFGICEQVVKRLSLEVGDTDRPGNALVDCGLKRFPCFAI